jgi:hypothetical protein
VTADIGQQSLLIARQPAACSVLITGSTESATSPLGVDERHVMHSTETSTSIPTRRPRLRALVGGVIAVGGLTFGIGAALAEGSASSVPAVSDHPAIAEMARANDLTGLSPASLAPPSGSARYSDNAAIADWARSNEMTGLSPASVAPTTSYWYRDNTAIADWARSEGLSGLSPASLSSPGG